jgi:phage baseplate assembly protein W
MSDFGSFLGKGWSFPPSFSAQGQQVNMVQDSEDIHQSLQILLATSVGERVMLENYGCLLSDFIFAEIDQYLVNNITSLIQNAINLHERRIILDSIAVSQANHLHGLLNINLSYTIRATNSRFNMVYPFFVNESSLGYSDLNV